MFHCLPFFTSNSRDRCLCNPFIPFSRQGTCIHVQRRQKTPTPKWLTATVHWKLRCRTAESIRARGQTALVPAGHPLAAQSAVQPRHRQQRDAGPRSPRAGASRSLRPLSSPRWGQGTRGPILLFTATRRFHQRHIGVSWRSDVIKRQLERQRGFRQSG